MLNMAVPVPHLDMINTDPSIMSGIGQLNLQSQWYQHQLTAKLPVLENYMMKIIKNFLHHPVKSISLIFTVFVLSYCLSFTYIKNNILIDSYISESIKRVSMYMFMT